MSKLQLSADFLVQATGGKLHSTSDLVIGGVCIDSRKVQPGDLFVAIPGERVDGHQFVDAALSAGAACAMVTRETDPSHATLLVDDATLALGRLAHSYRNTLSPITVGVTGSVGKTTTKQLISSLLSTHYRTHHTLGNYNNALGLPLTLLTLRPEHEAAVLEMGMSGFGEIEYLSKLACPDIAVITCIGTSHIEKLGSREGIRDAKLEIRAGMKENGILILNGDEPLLSGIDSAIYVGFEPQGKNTVTICNLKAESNQMCFDLVSSNGDSMRDLCLPGHGKHLVMDAALAVVVAISADLTEEEIKRGLLHFENTGMRQVIEPLGEFTLITDCYNASPESMRAALQVLSDLRKNGRCIAVLGDMLELGDYSDSAHAQVGAFAASLGTDLLLTFGTRANHIANAALENGMKREAILCFPDSSNPRAVAMALKEHCKANDTILFKASRGMALERVIEIFKEIENNG